MYRARIETLEKRTMFSAAPLMDLNAVLEGQPAIELSGDDNYVAAESLSLNFEEIKWEVIARRPETAEVYRLARSLDLNDLYLALSRTQTVGKDESISIGAGLTHTYDSDLVHGIAGDGTSNTIMFAGRTSIDVWEHANSVAPRSETNGIIAVLIGLTADPSDPSGNTVSAANFTMADGSVRFLSGDVSGRELLFGSEELFSRFASTTLDDESLMATTYGRGGRASQITHDVEFEKWASASHSPRL